MYLVLSDREIVGDPISECHDARPTCDASG
jgi:hypothetical protein